MRGLVTLALLSLVSCGGSQQQPDASDALRQRVHQNEILAFQGGVREARNMIGKEFALPNDGIESICPAPSHDNCKTFGPGGRFRADAVETNDDGIFVHVLRGGGEPGYLDYKPGRLASYEAAERDALNLDQRLAAIDKRCKTPTRIGMRAAEVVRSCWGNPEHVNRTETAGHVREQWVYPGLGYLYLQDGIVVARQTRE